VNLHGFNRFTDDIDVLIEATVENAQAVIEALRDLGLGTAWLIEGEGLLEKPITVFKDVVQIDIQVQTRGISFPEAWERRETMIVDGQRLCFLTIQDLIASKEAAGRPQDLEDLEWLRRFQRGEL
jgi:predicted nucleotidyltransferase